MSAAPVLKIFKDGAPVKEEVIKDRVEIGRGDECVIRLDDRAISRRHVTIRPVEGGIEVEKKSEFAPLSVNGAECTKAVVRVGDVIQIGPYIARVEIPASAPEPMAPPAPMATQVQPAAMDLPTAMLPPEGAAFEMPAPGPSPDFAPLSAPAMEAPIEPAPAAALEAEISAMPDFAPLEAPAIPEEVPPLGDGLPSMDGIAGIGSGEVPAPVEDIPPAEAVLDDAQPGGTAALVIDEDGATRLQASANLRVVLTLAPGKANVTEIEVKGQEIVIGRSKNCEIVLEDKKSSRKHTIVRRAGLNFIVKDLGSANGTYLNGVRIQEQELSSDDVIRIGDTDIVFKAVSADYEANQHQYQSPPEEVVEAQAPDPLMGAALPDPMAQNDPAMMNNPMSIQQTPGGGLMIPGQIGLMQNMAAPAQPEPPKAGGIIGWWRGMDPKVRRKYVIYLVVGVLLFDELFPDEPPPAPKPKSAKVQKKKEDSGSAGARTFDDLSDEQKRFVETQNALAFDHYRNKEYDKALYEVEKIFQLIPDYKNSREIERYAKEGKRKMDAIEEEKRKREEEAQLKARVAELMDEAGKLMAQRSYEQAEPVFGQILALDPENQMVGNWQREINRIKDEERERQQAAEVQEKINQNARDVYNDGVALKEKGKIWDAIRKLATVPDTGTTDKELLKAAEDKIDEIRQEIRGKLEPVLSQAKDKETSGETAEAYRLYEEATKIDPRDPAGFAGMERIRGLLHDKAKVYYVEGIVAESFSDFSAARRAFEECLKIAPADDIYYARAKSKLSRYIILGKDGGDSQ